MPVGKRLQLRVLVPHFMLIAKRDQLLPDWPGPGGWETQVAAPEAVASITFVPFTSFDDSPSRVEIFSFETEES